MILVAAAALVDGAGRVLLAERPAGKSFAGLWEFPGGKLEAGETPEAALERELQEELGVEAGPMQAIGFVSHAYEKFHLLMLLYGLRQWRGKPQGREGQGLRWVAAVELNSVAMPPADMPLLPGLKNWIAATA